MSRSDHLNGPQRIVCLSTETVESLYLMGQQHRIVGISGFSVLPPQARKEKPKVSGFTSIKMEQVLALKPDLVLGFSGLQADMLAELMRHGIEVHGFNQRSLAGVLQMLTTLGALLQVPLAAEQLIEQLQQQLDNARQQHPATSPLIYFEEWHSPLISGIGWVSELIELCGARDCFAELACQTEAKNRIVQPEQVLERAPDIIIGSWCGQRFNRDALSQRPGWQTLPAVRNQQLHEIKSAYILSPGPALIRYGLPALQRIVNSWSAP